MAKTAKRLEFEDRFRKERAAGNKTFEFDGKMYTTELAKAAPLPPKRPADKAAPAADMPRVSSTPTTEAQRVGRAVSDARSSVRRLVAPNAGMDTEAERGERSAAMAAVQRARTANVQAGNTRADEGILPGSSYARRMKTGGMVKAKKSSVRGAGCATRGQGKGKMY